MSNPATAQASAIPEAIAQKLAEWLQMAAWLEKTKKLEATARQDLVDFFFPAASTPEGTNKVLLPDGRELVAEIKINRNLDEAALDAVMAQLPEDSPYRQLGVLVEYKPKLVMKGFRTLPEDQARIFAQALTETRGMPSLEVREPKVTTTGEGSTPDWPARNPVDPMAAGAAAAATDGTSSNRTAVRSPKKSSARKSAKKGAKAKRK